MPIVLLTSVSNSKSSYCKPVLSPFKWDALIVQLVLELRWKTTWRYIYKCPSWKVFCSQIILRKREILKVLFVCSSLFYRPILCSDTGNLSSYCHRQDKGTIEKFRVSWLVGHQWWLNQHRKPELLCWSIRQSSLVLELLHIILRIGESHEHRGIHIKSRDE